MSRRLIDIYSIDCEVQIYLAHFERWVNGVVVRHAHPAVWVATQDGRYWFITNSRRIRLME